MFNRNWRNFRNSQILEEGKTREIDVVQVLSIRLMIRSRQLSKVINPKIHICNILVISQLEKGAKMSVQGKYLHSIWFYKKQFDFFSRSLNFQKKPPISTLFS